MDELHFLTSSAFYQPRSCSVTRRDRQSRTSVWPTSSTFLSSMTDRLLTTLPIHHSSLCLLHICLSVSPSIERRPSYWSWLNEAGSRSLQQIYVLTDSCWRRSPLSDKVLSQSDEVCSELWGLNVNVNGAAWKFCSECKPKASKRRKIYSNWSRTRCFTTTNSGQGLCL